MPANGGAGDSFSSLWRKRPRKRDGPCALKGRSDRLFRLQFLPREEWSEGSADGNMLAKQKSSGPPCCCYLTVSCMEILMSLQLSHRETDTPLTHAGTGI